MGKDQLEMLQAAVKTLEDFKRMRDVDSPTFDLGLALVKKVIDTDKISTHAR